MNTVSMAFVDIRKAFDKSDYYGILNMLIRHKININVINLIEHWFSIGSANVKWGDIFSKIVKLNSGVRQGGIISPFLFTAYIYLFIYLFIHLFVNTII